MKTKGALIREFNQPWAIEEIEIGDPAKNEVKRWGVKEKKEAKKEATAEAAPKTQDADSDIPF